jgi:hypothetical protein
VKFHVPVPLLVTHYLYLIYPSISNDCHSYSLIFTIILANNIFISTPLQCSAFLLEKNQQKWSYSIAMYLNKYTSTLLKINTMKLCIQIIMYFYPETSDSWETYMETETWWFVWYLTSVFFVTSGYNTKVCGIRDK